MRVNNLLEVITVIGTANTLSPLYHRASRLNHLITPHYTSLHLITPNYILLHLITPNYTTLSKLYTIHCDVVDDLSSMTYTYLSRIW